MNQSVTFVTFWNTQAVFKTNINETDTEIKKGPTKMGPSKSSLV